MGTSTDSSLEESLTQVGVIPGTAVYMSPEQAQSEDLDVRSDIFSFGVVLFEMATGKKPFTGTNVVMTLHAVINSKPASPRSINPAVPPELEAIIGKAMEKDRNQRYKNAAEMKADLVKLKKVTDPMLRSGLRQVSGLQRGDEHIPEVEFDANLDHRRTGSTAADGNSGDVGMVR